MLNVIVTIGAIQVLTIFVSLIRTKVVAVLLGPDGVGVISIIDQLVLVVAQLSAFSLPFAAVKFLSRSHSQSDEAFKETYLAFLKTLLWVSSAGAGLAVGVVIFGSGVLGSRLIEYKFLVVLGLLAVPTVPIRGFFSNVLAAARHPRTAALTALGIGVVLVVAAYVGISLGGVAGFYWANLLAGSVILVGMLGIVRRTLGVPWFNWRANMLKELKRSPDIVPFCLILSIVSFTHPTALFVSRYAILSSHGEAMTGLLHAVLALGFALNMVLTPTNGLLLTPVMNRNIPKSEKFRNAIEYQRMLTLLLAVGAIPLVLFPKAILILLFSPAFAAASPYVFGFVVAEVALLHAGVYQAILIGLDDIKAHMVISVSGHICVAGMSWFLAPQYGIAGVACALIAGNTFILVATGARLLLAHQFRLQASLAGFMAYLILGLVGIGALAGMYSGADVTVIAVKMLGGSVFVTSVGFFLEKEERASVYRLLTGAHLRSA